ncbi:MAG: hypothetical protein AAF297_01505 [Planctomycetota bacterium]
MTVEDPLAERRAARSEPDVPGVPKLPEVVQNVVKPIAPVVGRVRGTRLCTAHKKSAGIVRHVEIDVSRTALAGSFVAGQSFGVVPPGENDRGRPHKLRLYSIASPTAGEDGSGAVLATTVKRVLEEHWDTHRLFQGVASNYLCDLHEGDEVMVTGPSGKRFILPEDPSQHDYVFFATGTGIAPFRGMIGDLVARGGGSRVTLVMGVPYATDLLYHNELRALEAQHEWLTYLPTISRHGAVSPGGSGAGEGAEHGPAYVDGRLSSSIPGGAELIESLRSERTLIYVCGIAGMELGVLRGLVRELGEDAAAQYVSVAPEAGAPSEWTRRMISRQIRCTKRVFLEVY